MNGLWALAVLLASGACAQEPGAVAEVRVRDGLPNVFAKLRSGGEARIAYLGGSITMAAGWRVKTLAWFRERYPAASVVEINAAISGTGSGYGACRLGEHVLRQKPDLVFVEFRVNGGDGRELESVEGIVRQIWNRDPRADICFVYTISQGMLSALQSGRNTAFGAVMEKVAGHYGVPSIDLGVEVARREKEGSLVFKADAAPPGKLLFSKDGTHPGDEGHALYRDIIARSLLAMEAAPVAPHALPPPLDPGCWEVASLVPVADASLSGGWTAVDPGADPVMLAGGGRTKAMVPQAVKCGRSGESVTFRFAGTTAGLIDIPGPRGVRISASIDGQPPVVVERKDTYRAEQSMGRYFFLRAQKPGAHTARIEVSDLPEGMSYYVGPLLVAGPCGGVDK